MRDPFRPESSSLIIREAQIAFLVIATLVCVLIYVSFIRVSGRRFHFQQISRGAPVAENVADTPYPAQVLIEQEKGAVQEAFNTINALTHPKLNAASGAKSSTASIHAPPKVTSFEALPVAELGVAATIPVVPMPSVAQANFIEPADEKERDNVPFQKIKPSTPLPKPSEPFPSEPFPSEAFPNERLPSERLPSERKPAKLLPFDQSPSLKNNESLKSFPSTDSGTSFTPPVIESNFGENSTRKLSSFEPKPLASKSKANGDQFRFPAGNITSAIDASQKDSAIAAKPVDAQKTFSDPEFSAVEKQAIRPVESGSREKIVSEPNSYQVQPNDSLWSISTEKYGDGRFFRALHEHNRERIASVDQLQANTVILIPELAELKKRYPSLCPADQLRSEVDGEDSLAAEDRIRDQRIKDRFYVTQDGDTLFEVARQRLGQASRYLEIYELNQFRIPEQVNHLTPLEPGLRLLLPE